MPRRHFTAATFAFLRELKANNDRDWFRANQDRYERHVREPALRFIRDFEPYLEQISPYFRADDRRSGGSLFRIHRDVRFARDKSPYKTHAGIHFRHEQGRDVHCPGFYLHLEPRAVFVGAGVWRPDSPTAQRIRAAILADADGWRLAAHRPPFAGRFELAGESLKRPPRGVPADHPLLADLLRKEFIGVHSLKQRDVTSADFLERFAEECRAAAPLVRFLCSALEVPF